MFGALIYASTIYSSTTLALSSPVVPTVAGGRNPEGIIGLLSLDGDTYSGPLDGDIYSSHFDGVIDFM